jgi:hypothetical protein
MNGAHIVRVHDVANTIATVKILDALMNVEKIEDEEKIEDGKVRSNGIWKWECGVRNEKE